MSLQEFHIATTKELIALTNKVRNLIPHWGEDGRYKEAVLKNVIRRFLPEKYSIGTGFVIKQTENRGEHISSRQIDLIIYDNSSPVLFKEGDFVILTPDAVSAIIEVKANLQNQNLRNIIQQANENGNFIYSGRDDREAIFFNGIFSYEGYDNNFRQQTLIDNFREGNEDFVQRDGYETFKVNHVSINKSLFVKYWPEDEGNRHSLYGIEDLSFSFFISNLVDMLSSNSVRKNNFIWFATNKELNLLTQF